MHTKNSTLMLVFALSLLVVGLALADNDVELLRWTPGSGASDSAAGGVALRATLGQPVVGFVSAAGSVTLGQGFWHGGSLSGGGYEIYLPLIQR